MGTGQQLIGLYRQRYPLNIATFTVERSKSDFGRFCCGSPLQAFLVSDSVAVKRFATGAEHDGAAQPRPRAVFLFISA